MVTLLPLDRAGDSDVPPAMEKKSDRPIINNGSGISQPSSAAVSGRTQMAVQPVSGDTLGTSAVPSGGGPTAASPSEISDYQRRLYEEVARNSRYPVEAKRLRLSGVTHLAFRLDRLGHVLDSWVQESSGSELLDNAALEALQRAQPLPPIPPNLPSRMDFVIEIDSSLMQQLALSSAG